MAYDLSPYELNLLIEALARAASRHESEARYNPRAAGPHNKKAADMRKLSAKLTRHQKDAA